NISKIRNTTTTTETTTKPEINENLLSSLISAISGLLSESLGSNKPLKFVESEDRTLVLDTGDYVTCAILCDQPTYFLIQSLKYLRNLTEKTYEGEFSQSVIQKEKFKGVKNLIHKAFPFLVIEEKIQKTND
ncbi:MAG: hypothetical protein U9O98_05190, partial [Asgard group archaeon]|nr:hypothetical protein [Asgard group archaeon]